MYNNIYKYASHCTSYDVIPLRLITRIMFIYIHNSINKENLCVHPDLCSTL